MTNIKTVIEQLKENQRGRKEYFTGSRQEIAEKNISLMRTVSAMSVVTILLFMLLTPAFFPKWRITIEYWRLLGAMTGCMLVSHVYMRMERLNYWIVQMMCCGFCMIMLTGVMAVDVFPYPHSTAAFMPMVFIVVPIIFISRLPVIYLMMTSSAGLYILLVCKYKDEQVQRNDIFTAVIGLCLGIIVASVIIRLRVDDCHARTRFQQMSSIDLLTGILNKVTCENAITEYLKNRDVKRNCALIIMDVDDFKNVNDKLGHQTGDELLEGVGELLAHTYRSSDIVGRVGGDEFMVLMRNIADIKQLERKFSQVQFGLSRLGQRLGLEVTCSMGISVAGTDHIGFESMYQMADDALYEAKAFGKNQYIIHMSNGQEVHCGRPLMLIADDCQLDRDILREIFFKDYEILEAENGTETLSVLSQYKDHLAIVLLDLHMPDMNGIEILKYVQNREHYKNIPIVIITSDEKSEEETLLLGAKDMVRKPFEVGVVRLRVDRALR